MSNPFLNIDPAGITLSSDGSVRYQSQGLHDASVNFGTRLSSIKPNQPNCTNPANCGTNSYCTNTANCTGEENTLCKNRGQCNPSKNTFFCTDTGVCQC